MYRQSCDVCMQNVSTTKLEKPDIIPSYCMQNVSTTNSKLDKPDMYRQSCDLCILHAKCVDDKLEIREARYV
jgi:hypothetical protein